jgi:hypothetical protein
MGQLQERAQPSFLRSPLIRDIHPRIGTTEHATQSNGDDVHQPVLATMNRSGVGEVFQRGQKHRG